MQRFWETVIEPILDAVRPGIVVEIGSDQGGNTEHLLGFCRRTGATLHVVDPAPGYDAAEWQREHEDVMVLHTDLSLNALPSIGDFDAVLIDGDHNWYTVFHELKTIRDSCEERSRPFPLVLLHDIGWPYGRRDLYYGPDTIPEEYRKPYEKSGMRPGVEKLLEKGGLNQHLHNAVLENEPRSGVLTAVEDFLDETDHDLELIRLPGIHGLGILIPSQLREGNAELAGLLENLRFSPFVSEYVEMVERDRLHIQIRQQEELARHRQELGEESSALREARQQTRDAHQKVREAHANAREAHENAREAHENAREARRDLAILTRWMQDMSDSASALLDSRQWKAAGALSDLRRKALRQSGEHTAADRLQETMEQFRAWQEEHPSRVNGKPSDDDGGSAEWGAVERP